MYRAYTLAAEQCRYPLHLGVTEAGTERMGIIRSSAGIGGLLLGGIGTLAHLTCVSSTRETVRARIADIRAAGIQNVMALRGDIPADLQGADRSRWDYRHAVELVRELREADADFCIGGACYPEVHPESADQREDIRYLKEKVDAGCDFLTTQMFFDNNLYYNFCSIWPTIPWAGMWRATSALPWMQRTTGKSGRTASAATPVRRHSRC